MDIKDAYQAVLAMAPKKAYIAIDAKIETSDPKRSFVEYVIYVRTYVSDGDATITAEGGSWGEALAKFKFKLDEENGNGFGPADPTDTAKG